MFIDTTKKWFTNRAYDTFSKNGINRATLLRYHVHRIYRVDLNTLDEEGKFLATFQDFGIAIGFAKRINF